MMFYVYVIYSEKFDKIYIGFTSNLKFRLEQHNHPQNKGYTKRFQPWKIIYYEEFQSKSEAKTRENQLKSAKGRDFIWSLVNEKK